MYKLAEPMLGTGLPTSNGQKWYKHRKLLTPIFHMKLLNDYVPMFSEHAEMLVDRLKDVMHQPYIEIDSFLVSCALDIIMDCTMEYKMNSLVDGRESQAYRMALFNLEKYFVYKITRPWLWNDTLSSFFPVEKKERKNLEIVHRFTEKVMKMKTESYLKKMNENEFFTPHKMKKKLFIEHLLKIHFESSQLTMEEIREEIDTFIAAGIDTTAKAMKFTMLLLGLHPEAQEKASREVTSVFGDDLNPDITVQDLKKLKYLECVIKETLRLYTTLPLAAREARKTITVGKYTIPRGSCIILFNYMLHRDASVFHDPEKFLPERFFHSGCSLQPYSFIPFSAGSRNCIGQKFAMMEMKIMLSKLLLNFQWTSLVQQDEMDLLWEVTLGSTNPVKICLMPRSSMTTDYY